MSIFTYMWTTFHGCLGSGFAMRCRVNRTVREDIVQDYFSHVLRSCTYSYSPRSLRTLQKPSPSAPDECSRVVLAFWNLRDCGFQGRTDSGLQGVSKTGFLSPEPSNTDEPSIPKICVGGSFQGFGTMSSRVWCSGFLLYVVGHGGLFSHVEMCLMEVFGVRWHNRTEKFLG